MQGRKCGTGRELHRAARLVTAAREAGHVLEEEHLRLADLQQAHELVEELAALVL